MQKKMFGLLGKNISYSFSKKFFTEKFNSQKLPYIYQNFDIDTITKLPEILKENLASLKGFNVTIPYKEAVFQYLDEVDVVAEEINAVNCVKLTKKNHLKGFNTDAFGFRESLKPLLKKQHKKALILGTGGASKAVAYVLKELGISFLLVSRNPKNKQEIPYNKVTDEIIKTHTLIINTTPLGTKGALENQHPDIPFNAINKTHLLYDLIYNPEKTMFLKKGLENGATIKNGLEMLELQAEKSWEIWNE